MVSAAPLRGRPHVLPVGRRGGAPGRAIGAIGAIVAGVGACLLALVAGWSRPGGDLSEQTAPVPTAQVSQPAPTPAAAMPTAVAETLPAADLVRVLAVQQDAHGRWLARLRVGDGAPRLAQLGDALARGVRVERIAPDGVTVRRGGQLEHLPAESRVQRREASPVEPPVAPAVPRTSVIALPPGEPAPSSDAVERAIGRAAERATHRPAVEHTGR